MERAQGQTFFHTKSHIIVNRDHYNMTQSIL